MKGIIKIVYNKLINHDLFSLDCCPGKTLCIGVSYNTLQYRDADNVPSLHRVNKLASLPGWAGVSATPLV